MDPRNPYDEEYLETLEALRPAVPLEAPPQPQTYVHPAMAQVDPAPDAAPAPALAPDPELAAAKAQRQKTDTDAMIMDSVGFFNRAGGGNAPTNMGDSIRRTRDDPFTDMARERAMAAEKVKLADAERKRRLEIALGIADSPESLEAWDIVGRTETGKRLPMLVDAKGKLPGKYAPGIKDLLETDISLFKSQDKAAGEDPEGIQTSTQPPTPATPGCRCSRTPRARPRTRRRSCASWTR
jgi:hypothetical protein